MIISYVAYNNSDIIKMYKTMYVKIKFKMQKTNE